MVMTMMPLIPCAFTIYGGYLLWRYMNRTDYIVSHFPTQFNDLNGRPSMSKHRWSIYSPPLAEACKKSGFLNYSLVTSTNRGFSSKKNVGVDKDTLKKEFLTIKDDHPSLTLEDYLDMKRCDCSGGWVTLFIYPCNEQVDYTIQFSSGDVMTKSYRVK